MFPRKEQNGFWYIYYIKDGKRNKVSTKSKSKGQAFTFLSNFKKEMQKHELDDVIPITLENFSTVYLNHFTNIRSKHTCLVYKAVFKRLIEFWGSKKVLKDLNQNDVTDFLDDFAKTHALSSLKNFQILIFAFIKFAKKRNYISNLIMFEKEQIKVPDRVPRFFTKEMFVTFITKLFDSDFKDLVITGFFTGMRVSELINLTWNDVLFEKNVIVLSNQEFITKSGEPRTIPLHFDIISILKRRYLSRVNEFVFTHKFRKWNYFTLRIMFDRYSKTILGPDCKLTIHSLRHSFATSLVNQGVPIPTISELLGHSDISTTMIYTHHDPTKLKPAVDLLSLN